ncbi:D-3-phosphoglycerate dehydrogenase [Alkalibaculum bacchi]|uniref:D-3-phosphoglycerate dehydrogenase n=1 Tax=Alkalibaculum bacchi TaxID=645887 RepID=A0A366IAI9_9FIRM|nr:phosphoglycerate dehydrogenase [Alkalibaculum bacchi]RBP67326.1 D-3-phosphoglycerate dehydrogenase [Alkalibaculum bacchi]
MKKVLVTPRSFAKYNHQEILALFQSNNIEPIFNPYNAIMNEEQLIEALKDVDGLIVGVDPITEKVINSAPNLKAIAKYGVGIDNIDMNIAEAKKIAVSRTVGANSSAVADYSFALLMAVARRVVEIHNGCKNGDWGKKIALDVFGKKIGILGLGAIGRGMVQRAKGFNMDIYAYDIFKDEAYIQENNIKFVDVETIVQECDFISIHMPLTEETHHMINRDLLSNAKSNLVLINTARGGIVDEEALYEAIADNKIYGAGIDAFEEEPPQNSKLLSLENVVVGSHTAASSFEATNLMSLMATENIIRDLERM